MLKYFVGRLKRLFVGANLVFALFSMFIAIYEAGDHKDRPYFFDH
jgi:hypothetical protein